MKLSKSNSSLRVCVDSIAHGQISGRVYGQRLEKPLYFADIGDMLLQIDDVMNAQDYPRAFQRMRSFDQEEKAAPPLPAAEISGAFMSKQAVEESAGEAATFCLNVNTRQNTTWQGSLDWLDGQEPLAFRSVLELIRIISVAIKEG